MLCERHAGLGFPGHQEAVLPPKRDHTDRKSTSPRVHPPTKSQDDWKHVSIPVRLFPAPNTGDDAEHRNQVEQLQLPHMKSKQVMPCGNVS